MLRAARYSQAARIRAALLRNRSSQEKRFSLGKKDYFSLSADGLKAYQRSLIPWRRKETPGEPSHGDLSRDLSGVIGSVTVTVTETVTVLSENDR